MYSFDPTEEQQMLIDAIQRFAANDLRPNMRDAEENAMLPTKLIEKGWELGILQASIPEEYGGFGERSAITGVLAAEEMAYGDLAGALAVMAPALFAMPVSLAGSVDQKTGYLPEIVENPWTAFTAALRRGRRDLRLGARADLHLPPGGLADHGRSLCQRSTCRRARHSGRRSGAAPIATGPLLERPAVHLRDRLPAHLGLRSPRPSRRADDAVGRGLRDGAPGHGAVHAAWRANGPAAGRALLREVRASFYRKLFLAFVLAVDRPGADAGAGDPRLLRDPLTRRHRGGGRAHGRRRAARRRGVGRPPAARDGRRLR